MPDGLWDRDGVFYYDFRHPITRRRVRRKLGTNRKAALKIVAKLKTDLLYDRFDIVLEQNAPTFAEFAKQYLELVTPHRKGRRGSGNDEANIANLMPKFGPLPLNAITRAMAQDYLAARVKEFAKPPLRGRFATQERIVEWHRTHKPRKVSKTTANKDIKTLRAMLNVAVDRQVLKSNPLARIKLFDEREAKRKRLLQPQEIKALREAAETLDADRDVRDLVIIGLFMGRRLGEFLSLEWKNVDFENNFIYFPKTKKGEPDQPPMPPEVAQVLADRRTRAEAAKVQSLYVFPGRDGKGHRTTIYTAWKSIKRRAGITDLRYHDLRHAAISYMVMEGVDLMTIASLVGHTTADQIQDRYGHLRKEHQIASAKKFAPKMASLLGMAEVKAPAPSVVIVRHDHGGLHAWTGLATGWSQDPSGPSALN